MNRFVAIHITMRVKSQSQSQRQSKREAAQANVAYLRAIYAY